MLARAENPEPKSTREKKAGFVTLPRDTRTCANALCTFSHSLKTSFDSLSKLIPLPGAVTNRMKLPANFFGTERDPGQKCEVRANL